MDQPVRTADRDTSAFDEAAADYEALTPWLWGPVAEGLLAVSRPERGERVLDACCGAGASAVPAARAVGPAGLVDAVDLSGPMTALATRAGAGLAHLHVATADVTTWPGEGYDLVQCALGAFFFPDVDAGTDRLVTRARPGGRVALAWWRRDALVPAGQALVDAVGEVRGEPVDVPRPSTVVQRLGDPDALAGWIAGRGLAEVTVTSVPHAVPTDPRVLWTLVVGSGFRGLLAGLDEGQVADVRERYLGRLVGGPPVDATTLVVLGRRPGSVAAA